MNFGHKIQSANWSSVDKCWTLRIRMGMADENGIKGSDLGEKIVRSRYLFNAGGYYNHHQGYTPELTGSSDFQGQIVFPQFWPKDLNYTNKKVIIIGSGATTATLFPNMVREIGDGTVTILQRSPSYYLAIPKYRHILNILRQWFPKMAHSFLRNWSGTFDFLRYLAYRSFPRLSRLYLRWHVSSMLPKTVPFDPHFKPRYPPWEQRLCFVPDGGMERAQIQSQVSLY